MSRPLLILCPIEPRTVGNGLAMRTARTILSAARNFDVHVAVLPVAGRVPGTVGRLEVSQDVIVPAEGMRLRHGFTKVVANPQWREMLSRADPLPRLARGAFTQADEIIERGQLKPGTLVHVIRSYLAPLGCFVADRLGSSWTTLDLDDDDQAFASTFDPDEAAAYHRVVATFAPNFDAISAASLNEASVIGRRHGLSIRTLVNAVDASRSSHHAVAKPPTFLFIGNLTYTPNVDAAEFLAHQILPRLRTCIGGPVELLIIGAHDENGPIGKIGRIEGVTVTGFVDDLRSLYARASAVVAPLRFGAGTRIKLLEAFAHCVPVIASPIAVEGLNVETGVHFLQADTADSFAVAAARLVRDHELARALTVSASDYVLAEHSPERFDKDLAALFEDARHQGARRIGQTVNTNALDEPGEPISRRTT